MNLRKMLATLRAWRAGAPLGDVVVLKLDAMAAPPRGVTSRLEAVRGYAPPHDLRVLRELPAGTLGREYARFLDANGIEPLVISEALKERFRESPFALRYATTHDLHHVLAGFDTGLAGEAGVVGFNVGQGSLPGGKAMLWGPRLLWSLLSPTQARRIWHNLSVGRELGGRAKLVIAQPLEDWFAEPLAGVRERLGIPDPRAAGVLASGARREPDRRRDLQEEAGCVDLPRPKERRHERSLQPHHRPQPGPEAVRELSGRDDGGRARSAESPGAAVDFRRSRAT
jgi:ubiquinone biosynthesis protein Coq4